MDSIKSNSQTQYQQPEIALDKDTALHPNIQPSFLLKLSIVISTTPKCSIFKNYHATVYRYHLCYA